LTGARHGREDRDGVDIDSGGAYMAIARVNGVNLYYEEVA
jgi:hypothetical protein